MDDGGKLDYNVKSNNKSIVFNTHSFTDFEVDLLSSELSNKFNLDCSIRSNKGKKIIVISHNCYSLFYDLINPFILPQMRYKLP